MWYPHVFRYFFAFFWTFAFQWLFKYIVIRVLHFGCQIRKAIGLSARSVCVFFALWLVLIYVFAITLRRGTCRHFLDHGSCCFSTLRYWTWMDMTFDLYYPLLSCDRYFYDISQAADFWHWLWHELFPVGTQSVPCMMASDFGTSFFLIVFWCFLLNIVPLFCLLGKLWFMIIMSFFFASKSMLRLQVFAAIKF